MPTALVSLGANLGNSRTTINSAAIMLQDEFGATNVRLSSLLTSPAIGGPTQQDDFFNAVARIDTADSIFSFWHRLTKIESNLGRRRRLRWESRQIDLDILMYDDMRLWTPHLKVPHPRMVTRSFAILPAAQLCPNAIEPVSGWTLQELANRLGYVYAPEEEQLLPPSYNVEHFSEVSVFCLGESLTSRLSERFKMMPNSRLKLDFIAIQKPKSLREFAEVVQANLKKSTTLLVLAVVCPDPMSVAWEDYTRHYAGWLHMIESEPTFSSSDEDRKTEIANWNLSIPKYLLNCSDLDWGAHELQAAITAMQCEIFFATPGWSYEIQHEQ